MQAENANQQNKLALAMLKADIGSIKELAAVSGVSINTISRSNNGGSVKLPTLGRIVKALGEDPAETFEGRRINMELLLVLDLIVGTINIVLFAVCVWMGFQKEWRRRPWGVCNGHLLVGDVESVTANKGECTEMAGLMAALCR